MPKMRKSQNADTFFKEKLRQPSQGPFRKRFRRTKRVGFSLKRNLTIVPFPFFGHPDALDAKDGIGKEFSRFKIAPTVWVGHGHIRTGSNGTTGPRGLT